MTTQSYLKYPYTYENRTPVFIDGVLFIPEFFTETDELKHSVFSDSNWDKLCKHPNIYVEYCSGNGQWVCEMAKKHPEVLWIACEIKYSRANKIYKRIHAESIPNCIVVFGAAEILTKYYLKPASVNSVFINFPDPWPKKRHAKHRLFQTPFLMDLKTAMRANGQLCLATDDMPYLEQAISEMTLLGFKAVYQAPHYQLLPEDYGYSFFEDLWSQKGKQNYQTRFTKHD